MTNMEDEDWQVKVDGPPISALNTGPSSVPAVPFPA